MQWFSVRLANTVFLHYKWNYKYLHTKILNRQWGVQLLPSIVSTNTSVARYSSTESFWVPSDSSKDYLPFRDNRWWSIKDRIFDLITFPVNFMNGQDLFSPRSVEKSYHDPVTVISFFSCVHYMINLYNTILNNSLWRYKADLELKQ